MNFDDESAIAGSRRDKGYSFAGASESDINLDGDEGDGGVRDNDLEDMANMLGVTGVEGMNRLASILNGDANLDQDAYMGAMAEALAEASQRDAMG